MLENKKINSKNQYVVAYDKYFKEINVDNIILSKYVTYDDYINQIKYLDPIEFIFKSFNITKRDLINDWEGYCDSNNIYITDINTNEQYNNYVNTLKDLGAPNSITGRLLAYEEAYALGCRKYDEPCLSTTPSWLLYTNFYLGSARNSYLALISLGYNRDYYINNNYGVTTSSGETGVRPVIVVPTNEMPS